MTVLVTKIKEYREKARMKQSELADLVNVRRETIVHLENGKYNPSLKLAMDISNVFHATVEELFEFQECTEPVKAPSKNTPAIPRSDIMKGSDFQLT